MKSQITIDKNLDQELINLLENDEKVIWYGHPEFLPFFLRRIPIILFLGIFFVYLLPVVLLWTFFYLKNSLVKNITFVITSKKIIITISSWRKNIEIINFDQITNLEVDVGISDRICGLETGNVKILTAINSSTNSTNNIFVSGSSFHSIVNYQEVLKIINSQRNQSLISS